MNRDTAVNEGHGTKQKSKQTPCPGTQSIIGLYLAESEHSLRALMLRTNNGML